MVSKYLTIIENFKNRMLNNCIIEEIRVSILNMYVELACIIYDYV